MWTLPGHDLLLRAAQHKHRGQGPNSLDRRQDVRGNSAAVAQGQEFGCWDLYTDLIAQLIETEVEKLKPHEQDAVWLQTPEGEAWSFDHEQKRERDLFILDDVVAYVSRAYFFPKASDWGNRRIREYLDRDCLPDTLILNGQAQ